MAELDSDERAILDLSLRYGFSDERLAPMLQIELGEVADRREAALSELGERVGVDSGADRQALERALREVPHDTWVGRELRDPSPEPVAPVAGGAPPAAGEGDGTAVGEPRRRSRRVIAVLFALAAVAAAIVLIASGGDGGEPAHGPPASRQATQPPDAGAAPAAGQEGRQSPPAGNGDGQSRGSRHQGGGSANTVSLKPILGAAPSHATIRLVAAGPPAKITLALRTPATHPGIYEVWLYDTVIHAQSVARIQHGGGQATFTLPADASDYRYIDVSEEKARGFPGHSGRSVERVGLPAALAGLGL